MTSTEAATPLATATPGLRPWLVPAGLVLLSLVPVAAGAARLGELASDPAVTAANARFVEAPVPVVIHIVSVTVYSLVGAFQFAPELRRRHPRYHRFAGRVLVPAGLLTAASGIWMTLTYDLPAKDTPVVDGARLVVGTAMAACLVLGVAAILRGDVTHHRAWMARAYALAMGAGTQAVIIAPFTLATGTEPPVRNTVLMLLAWVLNVAVVEVVLRRRGQLGARR
ncbi:MAG: DUF2306 domain-containing protein [Promicromonosporaceae bacterium]|nr:DUF2306 domain-containing protein [Promicromonosporaceae bacterium]